MLSRVLPFRKKADTLGWRPEDLAECYRVVGLLSRSGLPVAIDSGLTDEGEPWAIVLREDTGDVLLHMARLDGTFVVVSAAGPIAQRGESLRAVLDAAIRTGGLAMLTRHSAPSGSEILRLHPSTLIAAVIAAALVHTQTSQAALLETNARREEWGSSRTDDARLVSFAALSPPAVLATSAASFAAVAVALHATQADLVLEIRPEDFIQAALELGPAADDGVPVNTAPIELANLELWYDGAIVVSPGMGERTPSGSRPDDTQTLLRLEVVVTPLKAQGTVDLLHFSGQQRDKMHSQSITWGVIDGHRVPNIPLDAADFVPAKQALPSLATTTAALSAEPRASADRPATDESVPAPSPAAEQPAFVRPTFDVSPSPPRRLEDAPVVSATLPVTGDETVLRPASSGDALAVIFKSAAQLLNLYGSAEASGFPRRVGEAYLATPEIKIVSVSAVGDHRAGSPSTGPSNEILFSAASDFTLSIEKEANFSDGGELTTKTIQETPLLNAQIILDFTNGSEHALQFNRQNIVNSLPVQLETGDTRKLLIFDAPWLEVKSFMLMPGVMMVEDDLLGGVNRAGMEMKGIPVSLDLGGGLNLTLLGVIDFGFT